MGCGDRAGAGHARASPEPLRIRSEFLWRLWAQGDLCWLRFPPAAQRRVLLLQSCSAPSEKHCILLTLRLGLISSLVTLMKFSNS